MKKDFSKDFECINNMLNKVRNINEMVSMDDDYDDIDNFGYEEDEAPAAEPVPENETEEDIAAEKSGEDNEIDSIRELALKGMIRLCRTPENAHYDVLKKIFTFCDKSNEKKAEGEDVK